MFKKLELSHVDPNHWRPVSYIISVVWLLMNIFQSCVLPQAYTCQMPIRLCSKTLHGSLILREVRADPQSAISWPLGVNIVSEHKHSSPEPYSLSSQGWPLMPMARSPDQSPYKLAPLAVYLSYLTHLWWVIWSWFHIYCLSPSYSWKRHFPPNKDTEEAQASVTTRPRVETQCLSEVGEPFRHVPHSFLCSRKQPRRMSLGIWISGLINSE